MAQDPEFCQRTVLIQTHKRFQGVKHSVEIAFSKAKCFLTCRSAKGNY